MSKINLTKTMVLLGYNKNVARSMKSRYLKLAVPSLDSDEVSETELVSVEVCLIVLDQIASGRGKHNNSAKKLSKMIKKDLSLYLSKENEVDSQPSRRTIDVIKAENDTIASEINSLKQRRDNLLFLLGR